jgi:hypothetical protein
MVALCWLFLNDLYYDVRIHEHQVTEMYESVMVAQLTPEQ